MKKMTPMRRAILSFISGFVEKNGYPPSVREIGEAVGLRSPSTVHSHLKTLNDGGYLDKTDRKTRAVKLRRDGDPVLSVPVVGRVTAGQPILAVEDISEYVPYKTSSSGEFFALRVRGDSMVGAGILDGDTVIVRRQDTAENGEIVVAMIGDEATVKRLSVRNNTVTLMPENELYEPIVANDARILGVVSALIRQF